MYWIIVLIIIGIIYYILYNRSNRLLKISSNITEYDHAIIIGGSIGGIVSAAYLSKYFKQITIIESDDVLNDKFMKSTPNEILDYRCRLESPTSLGRSGVSQIYQSHIMECEGQKILEELFPNLKNKLINEYDIQSYPLKSKARFITNGILLNHNLPESMIWLGIDRFTLEIILRKELILQYENKIQWLCNKRVKQLIVDKSLNIIKGVKYISKENDHSSSLIDIYGDFIIDCTGRNTSSIKWLKNSLHIIIPRRQIHYGLGYVTFIGERFKCGNQLLDSLAIVGTLANSPYKNTGFFITPIRQIKTTDKNSLGTLSTIALYCVNHEYPPNNSYENLLEWAKDNLSFEDYTILKSTKIYGPLIPYKRAANDRKYVELLGKKWPENYVLLGDAMCTFNPQYGQGMTHACRQARELNNIFKDNYYQLKDISYIYNRRASTITNECWLLSTTNDWKTPLLKVIETDKYGNTRNYQRDNQFTQNNNSQLKLPLLIKILQWYIKWFLECASKSGELSTDFLHVVNQQNSIFLLVKPRTLLTICQAIFNNYFDLSKQLFIRLF